MTDGMTQANQASKYFEKESEIIEKIKKFEENNSKDLAKMILTELMILKDMPKGSYNNTKINVNKKILEYEKY